MKRTRELAERAVGWSRTIRSVKRLARASGEAHLADYVVVPRSLLERVADFLDEVAHVERPIVIRRDTRERGRRVK